MATLDQLPAEERAIIELVLQQQRSYEDLSGMLGVSSARVKELARSALSELSPRTYDRVDPAWRGQLADYLLGQQAGPESTATRGHLKSSEAARAWAGSLLDALDPLYGDAARPEIPEAGAPEPVRRGRRERPAASPLSERRAREPSTPRRPLSPEAEAIVRRRRLMGALAALGAAAIAAVLIFVVFAGGDSKDKKATAAPQTAAGQAIPLGQLVLKPLGGEKGQGQAVIARAKGRLQLVVSARGLAPNQRGKGGAAGTAYEVWLYNSPKSAKSIGAQVTDQKGNYQGAGPLPKDFTKFKYIDITREPIDQNEAYSGQTVLRGKLSQLQVIQPGGGQQGGAQGGTGAQGQPGAGGGTATQPAP